MEPSPHNPTPADIARGYELRDARPRALLLFAIALLVGLLVVQCLGWMSFHYLRDEQEADDAQHHIPNPMARFTTVPPAPGVQPEPMRPELPAEELAAVRDREAAFLDAHGWVDANHQFVRIPLAQAMDLAVNEGLPETLPATQPSAPPSMPPASSLHGPGGVP